MFAFRRSRASLALLPALALTLNVTTTACLDTGAQGQDDDSLDKNAHVYLEIECVPEFDLDDDDITADKYVSITIVNGDNDQELAGPSKVRWRDKDGDGALDCPMAELFDKIRLTIPSKYLPKGDGDPVAMDAHRGYFAEMFEDMEVTLKRDTYNAGGNSYPIVRAKVTFSGGESFSSTEPVRSWIGFDESIALSGWFQAKTEYLGQAVCLEESPGRFRIREYYLRNGTFTVISSSLAKQPGHHLWYQASTDRPCDPKTFEPYDVYAKSSNQLEGLESTPTRFLALAPLWNNGNYLLTAKCVGPSRAYVEVSAMTQEWRITGSAVDPIMHKYVDVRCPDFGNTYRFTLFDPINHDGINGITEAKRLLDKMSLVNKCLWAEDRELFGLYIKTGGDHLMPLSRFGTERCRGLGVVPSSVSLAGGWSSGGAPGMGSTSHLSGDPIEAYLAAVEDGAILSTSPYSELIAEVAARLGRAVTAAEQAVYAGDWADEDVSLP